MDDDPPGTRPPPGDDKPERYPGLWQRVGEYWWESQDAGSVTAYWTGKHDAQRQRVPASQDWPLPVVGGLHLLHHADRRRGDRFPYAPAHAEYINAAKAQADAGGGSLVVTAERPDRYAPQPGT